MSDLDDILNRLRAQPAVAQAQPPSNASLWAQQPPTQPIYQQPSVSSPMFSPPVHTPDPTHGSHVISPASRMSPFAPPGAAQQTQDQNRTNNLLNLLKFNGQQPAAEGPMAGLTSVQVPSPLQRASSATHPRQARSQDLLAALQRKPSTPAGGPAEKAFESTAVKADTQNFLLDLLNKPSKSSATPATQASSSQASTHGQVPNVAVDDLAQSLAESTIQVAEQSQRETTPAHQFGSPVATPNAFEAPQPKKPGLFNYVNPFDQLHASSPLNQTPARTPQPQEKKLEMLKHGRDISEASGAPAQKTRKLAEPEPAASKNGKADESAVKSPQSVSEKLEGLSEQVHNEVEQALAAAGKKEQTTTVDSKKKKDDAPAPDQHARDDSVDSNWSTAEDEDTKQEEDAKVEVFNFPMRPFVTLRLTGGRAARSLRPSTWESATPIARLKKEFSHDDRALATASQSHIMYAVVPSEKKTDTGLKIIRQDDGKNKHIWAKNGERLCNVQVSSTADGETEAVLATGVNGTIFFTTLSKASDIFDEDDVQASSFVMSPPPNSDEASSGSFGTSSAIKTRAKLSNRHSTEYFAAARGRQIHLIAPLVVKDRRYTNPKTRIVDTEKYLAEHSLSINTGKAGKDFCFSEDDSVLISLDKIGKVKFWDIRALTSTIETVNQGAMDKPPRDELKEPVYSLAAGASPLHPDDKMSPSSIMLLDKDRPCTKGVALRYVLIGFQQNHILQLWDLGLGKCVQELRFPESSGSSNAMCTVNFHPKSSIICVGHPGRNSIYLIHLSAPRYNLPSMSQAMYINLLARQEPSLPRTESTAIMSGMREYSLGKIGDLRSVDMLKTPFPVGNASDDGGNGETLFELYVMHSKGVIGLLIKRDDLGWDAKGKMVKPMDAIKAGLVDVGDLNAPKPAAATEPAAAPKPEILQRPAKAGKKDRDNLKTESPKVEIKKEPESPAPVPAANGAAKPASPPIMQVPEAPSTSNPNIITAESYAMAAQKPKSPARKRDSNADKVPAPTPVSQTQPASPKLSQTTPSAPMTSNATGPDVANLLSKEFGALYSKLDQDKRVADAAGAARQDAILRLVSATLTENVEQTLDKIVGSSIEAKVLPALTTSTTKVVERKLAESLNKQVGDAISKEVKNAFPAAISAALRDNNVTRALSTHVVDEVTKQVKMDMGGLVQRSMQTVQTNMASQMTQSTQATQKTISSLEAQLAAQLREADQQRKQQNEMLSQLTSRMQDMASMVQSLQAEQVRMLQESSQRAISREQSAVPTIEPKEPEPEQTEQEKEVSRLTQLLKSGEYQQATIDWLQSSHQAELFDNLFILLNPLYLQQVSSLVALSVSAAITASFESNVDKRLDWLGTIISNMDHNDSDIRDVAPKIMDVLYQRLQGAYMMLAESQPRDEQALRKMVALTRQIQDVKRALQ